MDLETKLRNQLEYLHTMRNKYSDLNRKTKGKYKYRKDAIDDEIDLLERILDEDCINKVWDNCYEEDSRGVE